MNRPNTLYLTDRKKWRKWLKENFYKKEEIWLVYPKKSSGKPRIQYNDAVEEALCFGWIDSIVKSLDDAHSIQRFTPRKQRSSYSQANKERLKWLGKEKMIHPSMLVEINHVLDEKFIFPSDILQAIKADKAAWDNFKKFSESYKRIRIAYIAAARKRPEEFQKRLSNFIKKTRDNQQIAGFGGIEKYY